MVDKAKENIIENLDYDTVMDLEYLPKCFYETLRINPPIPISSMSVFYQQVTIKDIVFTPKTVFTINFRALHNDPT